jgi:hypothetical protein
MSVSRFSTSRLLKVTAVVAWVLMIGGGFVALTKYQNAPGAPAQAPASWPTASAIPHASDVPTLLVFAHPRCPCTDATMGELRRLMRHVAGRVQVHAVFPQPRKMADAWTEASLWHDATSIPGVRVWRDRAGRETDRFGAATSGQVLLYDTTGALRFQGGITGSRGHEGANAGRTALRSILTDTAPARTETFVFGCPLHEHDAGACTTGRCPR